MSNSSRNIVDVFCSGDSESFKSLVNKKMFELVEPKIGEITINLSRSTMSEEEETEGASAVQNTTDDPTLDPGMEREYFLKSVEIGDVLVTIKTIGVGKNKPVSVWLDDQRWEMFPGPVNAEKEAEEFISSGQFEKWKERKGLNNDQPDEVEEDEDGEEKVPDKEEKKDETPTDDKEKKESVLTDLKKILSEGKPQRITFKNSESMEASGVSAYYVISMYESLNKRNKVEFERILNKNKSEFTRAVEFSYKNLVG